MLAAFGGHWVDVRGGQQHTFRLFSRLKVRITQVPSPKSKSQSKQQGICLYDKNKTKVGDDADPLTPQAFALIKTDNVAETRAFGLFTILVVALGGNMNSCTWDHWGWGVSSATDRPRTPLALSLKHLTSPVLLMFSFLIISILFTQRKLCFLYVPQCDHR